MASLPRKALQVAAGSNDQLAIINAGFDYMDHPPGINVIAPKNIPVVDRSQGFVTVGVGFGAAGALGGAGGAETGFYWSPGIEWGLFSSFGLGVATNQSIGVTGNVLVVWGGPAMFEGLGAMTGFDAPTANPLISWSTGFLFTEDPSSSFFGLIICGFFVGTSVGPSVFKTDFFFEAGNTGVDGSIIAR